MLLKHFEISLQLSIIKHEYVFITPTTVTINHDCHTVESKHIHTIIKIN
jgi:hypothetical protein